MTRITVSPHALQRALQRYGLVNLDEDVIRQDVREALHARRGSIFHPDGSGYRCSTGSLYVWTACRKRLYVVARDRGDRRVLVVITSLPGWQDGSHISEARRESYDARRRNFNLGEELAA